MNKYSQRVQELKGEFLFLPEMQPITLSENDLRAIESALGYSLPTDYREFLNEFGGYSFGADYLVPSDNQPSTFGIVYGYRTGNYELLQAYHGHLANMVIVPEILPIACDIGGNKTCLFLAGENRGSVCWWCGEEATAPYDYSNLYPIADSFDEFMQLLHLSG